LKSVLNTLISSLSTILQFIMLNKFIKTNEWKHIVSKINLLVPKREIGSLLGVYIKFGTS